MGGEGGGRHPLAGGPASRTEHGERTARLPARALNPSMHPGWSGARSRGGRVVSPQLWLRIPDTDRRGLCLPGLTVDHSFHRKRGNLCTEQSVDGGSRGNQAKERSPTHLVPVAKRRRGLPTRPPPATPQPSVSSREELFSGGVHLANRCGTRKKSHHIPTRVAQCRVLFAAENS